MSPSNTRYASKAYAKTAIEVADPRQLEASLLLDAAAKLQAVYDSWPDSRQDSRQDCGDETHPVGLSEALLYNRKLWLIFIGSVTNDNNRLPIEARQNIANLGLFVLGEIFSLMTKPKPEHLASLIKINRNLAAGLSPKPNGKPPKLAAGTSAERRHERADSITA
jgi:flagellar biosynthesis activator protein FlaF